MKQMMITLTMMLITAVAAHGMSYEQARNEALFLTDKMAYELNLSDEQYEAAYEINLDYLMGVATYDDVYGPYWEHRNLDLSYILLDWQWQAFCAASYFYRPLYWRDGYWHFGIYARYPHRDYFYFGRPVFYATYRGAHAWHLVGGRGFYHARRDHFRPAVGRSHFGMLDRWNRGDFRSHHERRIGHNAHFGGNRNSSTRTTVENSHHGRNSRNSTTGVERRERTTGSMGGNRSLGGYRSQGTAGASSTTGGRSLGGSRSSGSSSLSGGHSLGGSRSSGSFSHGGTTRSSATPRSSSSGSAGRSSGGGHAYGGRR